jgi:hypothetical protein
MLGRRAPETLPEDLRQALLEVYGRAVAALGPVRFEWVAQGLEVWVVQLHRGATVTAGRVIFPGPAPIFHRFQVADGIDALRQLIARVQGTGEGIALQGQVGVTSHLGDLLRRARIPSRIDESTS